MPAGRPTPLLSVEPVMHDVTPANVDGLAQLTERANMVSPDLRTAARIARVRQGGDDTDDIDVVGTSDEQLRTIGVNVRRELRMADASVLAIRNGASGSILYDPVHNDLVRIDAVAVESTDPTGAGNAYAGALCAALASGCTPVVVASIASAVGAAFVRTNDWAPGDIDETRAWVRAHSGGGGN